MEKPRDSAVEYRCERKFTTRELTRHEIEDSLKWHPAIFSQRYAPRWVNNCYLDSPEMDAYRDNLAGIKDRVKVRVRWYGELFGNITKPMLELKIKRGSVGCKEHYPLVPFVLDNSFEKQTLADLFVRSALPHTLRINLACFDGVLLNRYRRSYFESADRRWRVTVDSELHFYGVRPFNNTFVQKTLDRELLVIELKYAPSDDEQASTVSRYCSFNLTRNSKYVSGLEHVYA